jgi:hypothetical protein
MGHHSPAFTLATYLGDTSEMSLSGGKLSRGTISAKK